MAKEEPGQFTQLAEFSIDQKRIREWHDQYNVLMANDCGAKKKCRRFYNSGRRPLSIDLGHNVFEFLEEVRSEGRVVTNDMLRTQIASGLSIQEYKAGCRNMFLIRKRKCVGEARTG